MLVFGGRGGNKGRFATDAGMLSMTEQTADGADGGTYYWYSCGSYYSAGGGGSGGSVLIDAPSMRGDATVSADGGAPAGLSTGLSGGGGGGRVGIHVSSTNVPAEIICSALGGVGLLRLVEWSYKEAKTLLTFRLAASNVRHQHKGKEGHQENISHRFVIRL